MPSGAKRRKAAKKKKAAAISNGNGEVKIVESEGGDNTSPALQHLETQQNPFTKECSLQSESVVNESDGRLNGNVNVNVNAVEIVGEEAKSKHDNLINSTNVGLSGESAADDGSQLVENGHSKLVKMESVAKVANDVTHNTADKLIHETECMPVQKSVGSAEFDVKSKKFEEKKHPSERFSGLEAECPQIPDTNCGEASMDFVAKNLSLSTTQIGNGEWNAGSSEIQQCAEKEPLLAGGQRQVNKTSWTGCCGLLELVTGSSR